MDFVNRLSRISRALLVIGGVALASQVFAEEAPLPQIKVTAADYAAAAKRSNIFFSAMARGGGVNAAIKIRSDVLAVRAASAAAFATGPQYPGDLGNLFGGAVMPSAIEYPLYLVQRGGDACTTPSVPACWGKVKQFLTDLSGSSFMHIVDQYVGATSHYTAGPEFEGVYRMPAVSAANPMGALTDLDMAAFAHALAVVVGGGGYGRIFHLFLT